MQKKTRSLLDEIIDVSFTKDKENVVESRASHIIESAIRLITLISLNGSPFFLFTNRGKGTPHTRCRETHQSGLVSIIERNLI